MKGVFIIKREPVAQIVLTCISESTGVCFIVNHEKTSERPTSHGIPGNESVANKSMMGERSTLHGEVTDQGGSVRVRDSPNYEEVGAEQRLHGHEVVREVYGKSVTDGGSTSKDWRWAIIEHIKNSSNTRDRKIRRQALKYMVMVSHPKILNFGM
jgi:hypothetical protein